LRSVRRLNKNCRVEILVLGHDDVTQLLSIAECIPLMRDTLAALSRGQGTQPLRTKMTGDGLPGFLGLMPGYVATGESGVLGVKLLGIFGGNPALGKDTHQGVVLLLDPATGEAKAVVSASAITAVRTAAVSAVATDALARPDATSLAVIGTGVQAQWHVSALVHVRSISRVRMAGRDETRGRALATRLSSEFATPVEFFTDAAEALDGADIVVTATNSRTPVLRRAWLAPGAHVNAVGACLPADRELDTDTVVDSAFYVDRRESALAEAGDFVIAAKERGFGAEHIRGELGEVLGGAAPGRQSPEQLTVFESLGLSVEDLAAAAHVCAAAERTGNGTRVRF
jgi:ornithine cyclodeaminase/alanine dehydrogenase-like protein (mu-crystallin family)